VRAALQRGRAFLVQAESATPETVRIDSLCGGTSTALSAIASACHEESQIVREAAEDAVRLVSSLRLPTSWWPARSSPPR
jgi:hypothetical protein